MHSGVYKQYTCVCKKRVRLRMGPKADPRKLRQYKLYANTENNELSFRELKFLGHVLSGEGIRPNPKKIQTIREWEVSGHRSE